PAHSRKDVCHNTAERADDTRATEDQIWRAALAAVMATVVTFGVWAATDLVFGGACIVGALCGVVAYVFTGMGGPEPVLKYQGDGVSVPGTRGLAPDAVSGAMTASDSSSDDNAEAEVLTEVEGDLQEAGSDGADAAKDIASGHAQDAATEAEEAKAAALTASDGEEYLEQLADGEGAVASDAKAAEADARAAADDFDAAAKDAEDGDIDGAEADLTKAQEELAAAGAKDVEAEHGVDTPAEETAPELYVDGAPGDADDLKKIKGVGPGLEKTLNEMGIYKFAQIATWGPGEIAWVDARLKFKGRITRDDWIGQAKEFSGQG
ncbi:MAG: hypothetical protein AAGP08_11980, partial [Pseudomonadota bacterium]